MVVTVILGKSKGGGLAKLEISLTDGEFSVCGETRHSGGQNIDHIHEEISTWDPGAQEKLAKVRAWWERWHLNHMRAGCEHQRAEKWAERPIDPSKPTNAYGIHFEGQQHASWNMLTWVSRKEHPQGLLSEPCPTCGYKYGSAWLKEEIPADVVAEIETFLSQEAK